jgi:uncharacterized protein YeaO (DUF488 family)
MNIKFVLRALPEAEVLTQKHKELAQLQAELAERELFLASLRGEIAAFERRYLRLLGALYAELDEWNAKIAESQATRKEGADDSAQFEEFRRRIAELLTQPDMPGDERFADAQFRMRYEEFRSAASDETGEEEFAPSSRLKSLYREAAKRVHPDLATDDADKEERQRLMAEANAAYQRGDLETLRRILEEYDVSPDSAPGGGVAAVLAPLNRQIKQIQRRLGEIELEIRRLHESDSATIEGQGGNRRARRPGSAYGNGGECSAADSSGAVSVRNGAMGRKIR